MAMSKLLDVNELMIMIFKELDYFDLKKCSLVSKNFKALTECSILDDQLFRSKKDYDRKKDSSDLFIHPAFDCLSYDIKNPLHTAVFTKTSLTNVEAPSDNNHDNKQTGSWALIDTAAANELAINRKVTRLVLSIPKAFYAEIPVENPNGVTVLDVMRVISVHGAMVSYNCLERDCTSGCECPGTWAGFTVGRFRYERGVGHQVLVLKVQECESKPGKLLPLFPSNSRSARVCYDFYAAYDGTVVRRFKEPPGWINGMRYDIPGIS